MLKNSFGTRTIFNRGRQELHDSFARRTGQARLRPDAAALFDQSDARERARREDGEIVTASHVEALARWTDKRGRGEQRILVHAGAGAVAGFYRRAGRRRPRRDARRDQTARRCGGPDQSAATGRSRDRPFGAGRLVWQRRARSRSTPDSNSSAIRSVTSSCAGARAPSTISAWCRPIPASSIR